MIIYVDIDQTICYCEQKKIMKNGSIDYSTALPYPERISKINSLFDEGNEIVYWTARNTCSGVDWMLITYDQLKRWGAKFTALKMKKPNYDLFIDDKAINSETYFSSLLECNK